MKTIYSIITAIILAACPYVLSGQKSVYTFPFENSYRLPSMHTKINGDEISATYQTYGNIYTTEITGFGEEKMEQRSMSYISDAKVVDAVRFLEFYMEEQLVTPGDESFGTVEMSIIYFHEKNRMNAGSVIGILTFGFASLLGVPYATLVTDVEVEASIFDEEDQMVTAHRGVGRGKKLQSLYSTSTRRAHQRAIRSALDDLNTNIMEDQNLWVTGERGTVTREQGTVTSER